MHSQLILVLERPGGLQGGRPVWPFVLDPAIRSAIEHPTDRRLIRPRALTNIHPPEVGRSSSGRTANQDRAMETHVRLLGRVHPVLQHEHSKQQATCLFGGPEP